MINITETNARALTPHIDVSLPSGGTAAPPRLINPPCELGPKHSKIGVGDPTLQLCNLSMTSYLSVALHDDKYPDALQSSFAHSEGLQPKPVD